MGTTNLKFQCICHPWLLDHNPPIKNPISQSQPSINLKIVVEQKLYVRSAISMNPMHIHEQEILCPSISFDELVDPGVNSSPIYNKISSGYFELDSRPDAWRIINDMISQCAHNMVKDPKNAGKKVLSMTVSINSSDCVEKKVTDHEDKGPETFLEVVRIEEKDPCGICLEQIPVGWIAAKTFCKHIYHWDCIAQWLDRSNKCPLCRFELTAKAAE